MRTNSSRNRIAIGSEERSYAGSILDHKKYGRVKVRKLLKVGSISGIEIRLSISWVITTLLIIISLAFHFHSANPAWGIVRICELAVITDVLFFASILMHELSHAIVARMYWLPVSAITLFALGGMTQSENESTDAKSEFWIGIVGVFTSAAIGFCCLALAWLNGWELMAEPLTPLQMNIVWLGYLNIGLGIINLTPAFPMDGGHVLRAIIWWISGDRSSATRRTLFTGMFFAKCYLVIGILFIINGAVFGGLLIVFAAWYLYMANRVNISQREICEQLRDVCVRDLMASRFPVIDGNTNLQTFIENHLTCGEKNCFVITQSDKLTGLITFQEVRKIARRRWPYTVIYDVMNRIDQLQTVKPEAPITEALELMGCSRRNQLVVMSNGQLVGIISRDHIMSLILARAEL